MTIGEFFKGIFTKSGDMLGAVNGKELAQALVAGLLTGGSYAAIIGSLYASIGTIITNPDYVHAIKEWVALATSHNWFGLALSVASAILVIVRKYYGGLPLAFYLLKEKDKLSPLDKKVIVGTLAPEVKNDAQR